MNAGSSSLSLPRPYTTQDPRPGRPTRPQPLHPGLSDHVGEAVVIAGSNQRHIVGELRRVLEQVGYLDLRPAALLEHALRRHQRHGVHSGELKVRFSEAGRNRLAVEGGQQRFGIEGVHVTGAAVHEQLDRRDLSGECRRLHEVEGQAGCGRNEDVDRRRRESGRSRAIRTRT